MVAKTALRPAKAPNLPIAPVSYDQRYQDQFSNVMRLYYAQLDNFLSALMANSGGKHLSFPTLFAHSDNKQAASADNTPTEIKWSASDVIEGFTLNEDGAVANQTGNYVIQYQLQCSNTDTNQHLVYVWLRVNGSDVESSCNKFSIPPATGASDGYLLAYGSIGFSLHGADVIQLIWATDKAGSADEVVKGVYLEAYPNSTSPFTRPSIPSVSGSIQFVSELSQ